VEAAEVDQVVQAVVQLEVAELDRQVALVVDLAVPAGEDVHQLVQVAQVVRVVRVVRVVQAVVLVEVVAVEHFVVVVLVFLAQGDLPIREVGPLVQVLYKEEVGV
jgi:hypothetical protein